VSADIKIDTLATQNNILKSSKSPFTVSQIQHSKGISLPPGISKIISSHLNHTVSDFFQNEYFSHKLQNLPILAGGGINSGSDSVHLLVSMKSKSMSGVTGSLMLLITPMAVL